MPEENKESNDVYRIPRTRYQGRHLERQRDSDIESGDIGFKRWAEIEPFIVKIRFYLEDVMSWGSYHNANPMRAPNNKELIFVQISYDGCEQTFVLVEDLDVFDHLMEGVENAN